MNSHVPDNTPQNKNYFEIQIPRFSFKDQSVNPYFFVITIAILSFLLGMLADKVITLRSPLPNTTQIISQNNSDENVRDINNSDSEDPSPPSIVNVSMGDLPYLGDINAKVEIVEFSDIQCPFCKKFYDDTFDQLNENYIKTNKVKFAFRHFPLSNIHPNAQKSHEATECANEQGKFWEYHDLLFEKQSDWSPLPTDSALNTFSDYAQEIGLDKQLLRDCLESDKYQQKVETDLKEGQSAGVNGTPAFFINGRILTGAQPFSEFEKVIEEELKSL